MPKRNLQIEIEQVRQLKALPVESIEAPLRKALHDRSNLVAAEAARVAGDMGRAALIPDLLSSFDSHFSDPVKTDPKCWAKTAIVKALAALDYNESAPFLRAARHVQMEAVWGGREDSAVQLRANGILALVQCVDLSRVQILKHLVDALADPVDPVRREAVRAIEQMNGDEGILLLRLKAHSGDREPQVLGQVFDSLLNLEGERAVRFLRPFLESGKDEVRDEAALALGGSRLPVAVRLLKGAWEKSRSTEFRSVLLRAMSVSREESAMEFLLELVKSGVSRDSAAALEALRLHADSPEIRERVEQAQRDRKN